MSNGMTHSHDAVRDRAEEYVLGLLDESARRELEAEAASCPICTAELRQLIDVGEGLARLVPPRTPPAHLRARVMTIPESSGKGQPVQTVRPRSFERWWAIAATIAAIVAGSYAMLMRGRVTALESELRVALARVNAAESQLADLREATGELRRVANVLVATDVRSVNLTGQNAGRAATGRAFFSPDRGLVFTASGLPQLDAAHVYQLWYITPAKETISAGIFKPDQNGSATTSSIVRPAAPVETIAVTVEPAGGLPKPSGAIYLAGGL
jgi:anti-sigma-K factor RskA